MTDIQKLYENACNNYARKFARKHELQFDFWVADTPGTIAMFGDYYVDFGIIKYDIDNQVEQNKFTEYYDEMLEHAMLESNRKEMISALKASKLRPFPNYSNYVAGAPRPTQEELQDLKDRIYRAKTLLEESINDF